MELFSTSEGGADGARGGESAAFSSGELMAGADGELSAERQLELSRAMGEDRQVWARVLQEQELRRACGRVLGRGAGRCPAALREAVGRLLEGEGSAEGEGGETIVVGGTGGESLLGEGGTASPVRERAGRPGVWARVGRWAGPMAAAAAVAWVLWAVLPAERPGAGLAAGRGEGATAGADGYTSDGLITAGLAQRFGQRHARCAADPSLLYDRELYPAELGPLTGVLGRRVGGELEGAALDLGEVGYRFDQAGSCTLPGRDAAHLIYRNARGQTLSLWVKAYDGRPTLDPGVAYRPPRAHSGRPMVVWREGQTVFYLVGDVSDDVQRARPAIHLSSV